MQKGKYVNGISDALFKSDFVATRLTLAMAELLWAIMLFWPGDTFNRPTYTLMGMIAPELCWAVLFLFTAGIQYYIVATKTTCTKVAWYFSCWNALIWLTVVGCMLLSVYPPPAAVGGEIALMVSAIWIWVCPLIIKRGETKYGAS